MKLIRSEDKRSVFITFDDDEDYVAVLKLNDVEFYRKVVWCIKRWFSEKHIKL